MIVNKQKHILFRNECNCIVDEDMLREAIMWKQTKPTSANKKIYLHGKYPCVSIHDKKIHVHRLIYSFKMMRELLTEEYIHHIDHNRLNASIDNLELMHKCKHQSLHNKGKKISDYQKEKIRESNRRRIGVKYKIYENKELLEQ